MKRNTDPAHVESSHSLAGSLSFLPMAVFAVCCAAALTLSAPSLDYPVLGNLQPLPATLLCAALGWFLLRPILRRGIGPSDSTALTLKHSLWLVALGAVLALPPIAIDIALPFPEDINLPLPWALLFYPAIALVAEVLFHLLPLALTSLVAPKTTPTWVFMAPVVLAEPLFQVFFSMGPPLQSLFVFFSVALVSAAQLWMFVRYGFAAMMGLRITFYLFWHVIWGTARLLILF